MFSPYIFLICFIAFLQTAITGETEEQKEKRLLFSFNMHPESFMTSMDMMVKHGYSVEWHTVTTRDGYLLELHRMPARRYTNPDPNPRNRTRLPVLLIPGILCTSAEYTNNFPSQSLGYMLADAGYDVWMMNFRGSAYSRRHVSYQPTQSEFWDWSWQQMAENDLPSVIDFVLQKSFKTQIYLVGHSMGTTVPFAMLSTLTNYNPKVRSFFALSPVVYLRFAKGLINILALLEPVFRGLIEMGMGELLPQSGLMQAVANTICNGPMVNLCEVAINLIFGDQPGCLNKTRMPVYLSHFPSGTSVLTPIHFFQVLKTQKFGKFDLGRDGNLRYYGTPEAPMYNLNRITTYVNLYYIDGDYVSNQDEVGLIQSQLTGAPRRDAWRVDHTLCGHIWLVWGPEMGPKGNQHIIGLMERDFKEDLYQPITG